MSQITIYYEFRYEYIGASWTSPLELNIYIWLYTPRDIPRVDLMLYRKLDMKFTWRGAVAWTIHQKCTAPYHVNCDTSHEIAWLWAVHLMNISFMQRLLSSKFHVKLTIQHQVDARYITRRIQSYVDKYRKPHKGTLYYPGGGGNAPFTPFLLRPRPTRIPCLNRSLFKIHGVCDTG